MNNYYKLIAIPVIIFVCILLFLYMRGSIYRNKIKNCKSTDKFCGIKLFKYKLPDEISNSILSATEYAVRVNITNWKAGKTISTKDIPKNVIDWYKNTFVKVASDLIGEKLEITPLNLPTSCCVLIYDEENDFIDWHFDQNFYDGRFFTVLIPITFKKTCTDFVYKDKNELDTNIDISDGTSIIFEGEKLFHMASKLCKNQSRIVLSLQYTTNSNISLLNRLFMRIKDIAYIGLG